MKALSVLTAALLAVSTSALAETKASVVLVHGAFADGSSWNKVITLLQKQNWQIASLIRQGAPASLKRQRGIYICRQKRSARILPLT